MPDPSPIRRERPEPPPLRIIPDCMAPPLAIRITEWFLLVIVVVLCVCFMAAFAKLILWKPPVRITPQPSYIEMPAVPKKKPVLT